MSDKHAPQIGQTEDDMYTASCRCGWRDPYYWSARLGAQIAVGNHLLAAYGLNTLEAVHRA